MAFTTNKSNTGLDDRLPYLRYRAGLGRLLEEEIVRPPLPSFLDLEITSACQLRCPHCARTFLRVPSRHIDLEVVESIVNQNPALLQVMLVGLGEPLLHPQLDRIVAFLIRKRLRIALVTNAMIIPPGYLDLLTDGSIKNITISMDSADPDKFSKARAGGNLQTVVDNARLLVREVRQKESKVVINIFCTLHPETINGIGALARLARQLGIPAIVVSDLNFSQNSGSSLAAVRHRSRLLQDIGIQMREAAAAGVVLLLPNILDTPDPASDWPEHILKDPEQLLPGKKRQRRCLAPWRTMVARVDGTVDFCNCTPRPLMGQKGSKPEVVASWHAPGFQAFRREVYSERIPATWRIWPLY